jgi:ATP-binding cassette subfamily B protein
MRLVAQGPLGRGRIDRINQVLREQITGVRVIRAFLRGPSERQRFQTANADLTAYQLYNSQFTEGMAKAR